MKKNDVESSLVADIARQISIKVYAAEYKTSTLHTKSRAQVGSLSTV